MRRHASSVSCFVTAILLAGAITPLAAHLVLGDDTASTCSCLVKMDCCRKGLCHMDEGPESNTTRWAACSRSPHDEPIQPLTTVFASCESRFEIDAPRAERDFLFEGVSDIPLHSNDAPDHVPIS